VELGLSAFIPKTYIPGDRHRASTSTRRLTRCTSLEMSASLEQDLKDAFGELPRQVLVLFALTELRLLSGIYGIDSIIRKDPDVGPHASDVTRAEAGLGRRRRDAAHRG